MRRTISIALACLGVTAGAARAQDAAVADEPAVQIHGFVSAGGFVSTANDYIGESSGGSLELFEVGLNASTEPVERLRVGVQLFARRAGEFRDEVPRIDWAYGDYRFRSWLGLRFGVVRMPFGLYNEYVDIDAARTPILLPQGIYPIRNRDVLLSQTGLALYGNRPIGSAGELDYQVWGGSLNVPENALILDGAALEGIETRLVAGAQLFWQPPADGLRIGGTYLRAAVDFDLQLDPELIELLEMAGVVPPGYDGELIVSQRPISAWVASVEYLRGEWSFAAEYGRASTHQTSSLPMVIQTTDQTSEQFYAMVTRRLTEQLDVSAYLSVHHLDAHDRRGQDDRWAEPFHAWQRDAAATVRYDVNDHWLWKFEAHLIDGAADLSPITNPDPERYWGMFLFRTTVTY